MASHERPAKKLVLDTNVFIHGDNLLDINKLGDELYTTPGVIAEMRDSATQIRYQNLPFEIQITTPTAEALQKTRDAAQEAGELQFLSSTDISVVALAYQFNVQEKENNPDCAADATDSDLDKSEDADEHISEQGQQKRDDDMDAWITPDNINEFTPNTFESPRKPVPVACYTADRAMQSVLLSLGVRVLSPDGRVLKQVRSLTLKCSACGHIHTKEELGVSTTPRVFCAQCGNRGTLMKIAVFTNADGSVNYSYGIKNFNTRGTKFPLPAPRSGKGSVNPELVEDYSAEYRERQRRGPKGARKAAERAAKREEQLSLASLEHFISESHGPGREIRGMRPTENWERRNPNATRHHH